MLLVGAKKIVLRLDRLAESIRRNFLCLHDRLLEHLRREYDRLNTSRHFRRTEHRYRRQGHGGQYGQ